MLPKELARLQAVHRFLALEINKEKELKEILKVAAEICQTPTALITLLDEDTQHIIFRIGFDLLKTNKRDAFCKYVIQQQKLLTVDDAQKDDRFCNNPLVKANPGIRFYAGAPLTTQDGHHLGSLCVIDQNPGHLTDVQARILEILARQVIRILEFEMSVEVLKQQYKAAKSSETKMRSFFESSVSCHLLLGKDFDVLAYNKVFEKFVEDTLDICVSEGMDIRTLVHQSNTEKFIENYKIALSGSVVSSEIELTYKDKTIYWYINYEPAYDVDGQITGVSYNASDITDRIKQERLVRSQNKSLREIAFIQSHELRRPVSSILGMMDLIQSEDYSASRQDLIFMQKAVEELDEKIRKIIDFT